MTTYSVMDALLASPETPLPEHKRERQLVLMYEALNNLETAPEPTRQDWERVNDVVLLMDTLLGMNFIQDPDGLIEDAADALGKASDRAVNGKPIRLDGPGLQSVRNILTDYAEVLSALPARTMIQAHRKAEQAAMKLIKRRK